MKRKVYNPDRPENVPVASQRRPMSESFRYTDLAAAIQLARSNGLRTVQIVRALSANMTHTEALTLARRAAPLLEIKVSEFMSLRRNE